MRPRKASVFKDARAKLPWVVRWTEWTEDGRKRRPSKSFARQREAEKFANWQTRIVRGEIAAPVPRPQQDVGLGDTPISVFVDTFIERRAADHLRPSTLKKFRESLGRVVNHFGAGTPITSISRDDLAQFVTNQTNGRRGREGEPISKSTRNGIVRDIRTAFGYAKSWGYIESSPADGIRVLPVRRGEMRSWHFVTPSEFLRILRHARTIREKALYSIAYGTGLRFGELFSLRPSDIDLVSGYVHVRQHEATDATPPFVVKDYEDRSIPLPRYAARLVAGWMSLRDRRVPLLFLTPERMASVSRKWRKLRQSGQPWQNAFLVNNTLRTLKAIVKRAGIVQSGAINMHSLRKSYGKNGARVLPAEVLQSYMGHSDIATTLTYYSKRDADDDARARWALDALIRGDRMQNLSLNDVESDVETPSMRGLKVG